jgi:subtilase family serine protease
MYGIGVRKQCLDKQYSNSISIERNVRSAVKLQATSSKQADIYSYSFLNAECEGSTLHTDCRSLWTRKAQTLNELMVI